MDGKHKIGMLTAIEIFAENREKKHSATDYYSVSHLMNVTYSTLYKNVLRSDHLQFVCIAKTKLISHDWKSHLTI